ncbi:MAG: 16S rRNA (adenine(1518)-N(6)/adenine(1519)-N(6))-dimethyltransferase RsmA [DPANN group archaeon]|nr:16S rRNA (adenine(1518)-N(6)/adenine(1519)-N(6))-dimethyltransferase RsmA [DPANN group archaeon]
MSIISDLNIRPDNNLGQNFLVDKNIIGVEIREAEVSDKDTVLEIGAGYGALTIELAKVAKKVIAVELDSELAEILQDRLTEENITNVEIIQGDILKVTIPPFDKCVANIPYQISSKIVELLGRLGKHSVLIMQREFADRLVANPGEKNYSRISVLAQYHFTPKFLRKVGKKCFYPTPKVNSAIIKLLPKETKAKVLDEEFFFNFVRAAFIHKNQKLWKAISHSKREMELDKDVLVKIGHSLSLADVRVRTMNIDQLALSSCEMMVLMGK